MNIVEGKLYTVEDMASDAELAKLVASEMMKTSVQYPLPTELVLYGTDPNLDSRLKYAHVFPYTSVVKTCDGKLTTYEKMKREYDVNNPCNCEYNENYRWHSPTCPRGRGPTGWVRLNMVRVYKEDCSDGHTFFYSTGVKFVTPADSEVMDETYKLTPKVCFDW